ncbi:unnamed protein product [Closterium sp. NIES-54]
MNRKKLRQIDVANAFLYAPVDAEIFDELPHGSNAGPNQICQLEKSLYGIQQAPRLWQQHLHACLFRIGFLQLPHDQGLYRLTKGTDYILLIVYVDELLYIVSTDAVTTWFEGELQGDLTLTVATTVTQYLGLNIEDSDNAIYLSAAKYTDTIAKRFGLIPTTISMPYRYTDGNRKASAILKPAGVRDYQRKLGCLLFAAVTCRPDLSYSASQLATYLKKPEAEHMLELDRALHYLSVSKSVSGLAWTFLSCVCTLTEVVSSPPTSYRTSVVGRAFSTQPLAPCLLIGDLAHTALDRGGWRCVGVPGLGFSCLCSRYVRGQALRRAIPCVFLGFVPDAPGWRFYHPTSRRVLPSHDVTFDESVSFYRLFPYRSAPPPPPPPLFLAPGPPPVDPLPPQGPAPSGVSQVDPLLGSAPVEVAIGSGAARGAAFGGAEPGGAESEGAGSGGAEPGGEKPGGAEPEGVEPGGAESEGVESRGAEPQGAVLSGATRVGGARDAGARAGGAGALAGAGGSGGTAAAGPGGARTRGSCAGGAGAGGAGVGGTGTGGAGAAGAGAVDPGTRGARGTVRPRPYFVPLLQQVLGVLSSTSLSPSLLCPPPDQSQPPLLSASPLPAPSPYTAQFGGLTERPEPPSCPVSPVCTARRVPCLCPPPVPGTHAMALRPSSVPLRVPLPAPPESSLSEFLDPESDRARAASPFVSYLFSALLSLTLLLNHATTLVAESESASLPSVGGECALGTDVLEDRQEDFECLAAAIPRFASMLLASEGDPDAPDIPTPRSYAEAITGPYSSQWQAAMDAEMASWKSTSTYVNAVLPLGANIVDGMWIFRVNRPPGSPPAFKARYVARGFSPSAPAVALTTVAVATAIATAAIAAPTYCAPMALLSVLAFDHEGRSLQFDMWLDDLQLYLLSDSRDSVSLFDLASGAATAPPATADSATRSQWLTRDAAARLAIRNHLPLTECAHFGQHRTAQAQYAAIVARYSSPATAALGRLLLPYLFPELSAFATVKDLSLASMTLFALSGTTFSLDPTSLTVDLLEQHLLAAETSAVAVGAARGTPRPPFFEGCSPSPLAPSYASATAVDVSDAEDVRAASASAKRRNRKGKGDKSGGGGSGGGGGGSESSGGGSSGGGGGGGPGGGSGGSGGSGGGSSGSGGSGGRGTGGSGTGARRVGSGGGQRQQPQHRSETQLPQQLCEWFLCWASGGSCLYVIRMGVHAGHTCGKLHTQHRCFSCLDDAWRGEFGDIVKLPRWADLLRSRIAIFDLEFDAILSAVYALSVTAEGDCYRCVPPDPGIAAAALGANDSGTLPSTAPAQALHTFTLDSGASRCFFRDSTTLTPLPAPVPADPFGGPVVARSSNVLPCLAVPSSSLSGLHLPSFSTNLVSTAALQDAMVTTTTPGGQRVSICTCTRTGRHLATFTRRPGSSLYTLATEPPQVAASAQVSASGQVAASCSCRLLSHRTLLWHHRLGHPSLPRLRGMHSRLLVYGLPRSLPPLPPSPAPPCLPCVEGRQRAAPHSSSFPPTNAPVHTLYMDMWGPARATGQSRERYFLLVVDDYTRYTTVFPLCSKGEIVYVLIPWIRSVRLQLREWFGQDLPILRLHFDRGVMKVARTSMIHAAARHFLWPFAVRYVAHQLNLWPRVSLPETSPTLRWTGEVGDASVFWVWGSCVFVRDTSADKLSARAIPSVFLGFVPDASGWQFYHGPACASPRVSPPQLREWLVRRARLRRGALGAGDAGAGGAGVTAGARGPGGTTASGPGCARTRGAGAAGTCGVGGAGAGDPTKPGAARDGGSCANGAGAGGAGAGGAGVGGTGAGGTGAVGAGVIDPGARGAGGTVRPRPRSSRYSQPLHCLLPLLTLSNREPASCPVSLVRSARRAPHSRPPSVPGTHAMALSPSCVPLRVPLPAPLESFLPKVPDPESDRARAASPTVSRLLATAVTDPFFESAIVSDLVAGLLEFAGACRLDYATALVAESAPASPQSVGGECVLGTYVLEERQEDFECLVAVVPRFASMLLAPEGDPDAPVQASLLC